MSQSETGIPHKPEKENKMSKFKVGDKVKVIKSNCVFIEDDIDAIGTVCDVVDNNSYLVDFHEVKEFTVFGDPRTKRYYRENEVALVKDTSNWKIVIIPDGDKTTALYYENGKVVKTEEVKRYFKDEYSVKGAVEALTKKLFNNVSFNWEGFKKAEFGVRFRNEFDYNEFMKQCDEQDITWANGEEVTKWKISYHNTLVILCNVFAAKGLTWTTTRETLYDGKPIIEYKGEEPKVKPEPKFKPGDLVEVIENFMSCPVGLRGHIVRKHKHDDKSYFVDFRVEYSFTHTGNGDTPERTGYFIDEKCLKKVN